MTSMQRMESKWKYSWMALRSARRIVSGDPWSCSLTIGGISGSLTHRTQLPVDFWAKLDDVRFFSKALDLAQHQVIFNGGRGDLSLTVDATYPTQTHQNPVTLNLNFRKYGQAWPVDLNASQYSAPNTSFHSSTSGSSSSHVLELNVDQDPAILSINLLEGLGKDEEGDLSKPLSLSLGFGRPITRLESLQAWWTFDENTGTVVNDYLGRFVGNFADDGSANVTFRYGQVRYCLAFPKERLGDDQCAKYGLQINGNKPRTVSFWMFVESGQSGQPGPYGIGRRACPNGTHQCWAIRSFWDGNYRRFRSQHWCWDPDVYVSEGFRTNGFTLPTSIPGPTCRFTSTGP